MPIKKRTQTKVVKQTKVGKPVELKGLTKNKIISELTKSPHGDLALYAPIGLTAAQEDPNFFGRLVAWNHAKGQVRDAKVALPVLALTGTKDPEFQENALAHLADLRPREFARALAFAHLVPVPRNVIKRLVERYLRDLEADKGDWERTALLHRNTLKGLYAKYHVKPVSFADDILFKGLPVLPRFMALARLKTQTAEEIAGTIRAFKLPSLIVRQMLGARLKEPDILVAVIQAMGPTELISNMKQLKKLGVKDIPAARAALEAGLDKAAKSAKALLKTSVAADAQEDEGLAQKLRVVQEKQLEAIKGIAGSWLVAGDRSPSMEDAIEATKEIAVVLARLVRGRVACVFFDERPTFFDVTGKSLEEIKKLTRHIKVGSSTGIGSALQYCIDEDIQVDGIAIVSDGEENVMPVFAQAYQRYVAKFGTEPTVYFYWMCGSGEPFLRNCASAGIDVQIMDLKGSRDYASLPNLVQTMRVGRYSLFDEIMGVELRTLDQVLDRTKDMSILKREVVGV